MKTANKQRLEIIFCSGLSMFIGAALGYFFGVESALEYARQTLLR